MFILFLQHSNIGSNLKKCGNAITTKSGFNFKSSLILLKCFILFNFSNFLAFFKSYSVNPTSFKLVIFLKASKCLRPA